MIRRPSRFLTAFHSSSCWARAFTSLSASPSSSSSSAKVPLPLLKSLRDLSGAPMTECKEALLSLLPQVSVTDAQLLALAEDVLRKKGLKTAAKKAGRVSKEGLTSVSWSADRRSAAVIEINSETDFCARSERFQKLAARLSSWLARSKHTVDGASGALLEIDALLKSQMEAGNTMERVLGNAISSLRENVKLRRAALLAVHNDGVVGVYVHNAAPFIEDPNTKMGNSAALVALEWKTNESGGENAIPMLLEIANKLAMQVTAASPRFLSIATIPDSEIQHERLILEEQQKASGKKVDPKHLGKAIDGRMTKFYSEVALTEQLLLVNVGQEEDKPVKVGQFLADLSKRLGGTVHVTGFVSFKVGEGVLVEEKMPFADEVASKLKAPVQPMV